MPSYAGLDRFGRVVDLLWRNYGTGEDVVRIKHGYDRAGNRLYREDPVARTHGVDLDEAYTYDGLYQLKTFVRGALNAQKTAIAATTFRQAWDFDTTGNWSRFREDKDGDGRWDLDQARTHNAANELLSFSTSVGDPWSSPAHDRNGNMVRIPQPKDPTKQFTLRYDPWNRLVRVSDPAGPVADYHYDGRNFRVVKEVHRDPADPIPGEESYARYPETRHFYYNSSWQCLEERASSSTAAPADSLPADRQFVWGLRYIDDLLLRDRATQPGGTLGTPASGLEERLYGLQDPNWNVVAIADTNGVVAERCSYEAYGEISAYAAFGSAKRRSPLCGDTVLHSGRELDTATGLTYFRSRYYHPELSRFVNRDSIGGQEAANLYEYVRANPVTFADPSGHQPLKPGEATAWREVNVWSPFEEISAFGRSVGNVAVDGPCRHRVGETMETPDEATFRTRFVDHACTWHANLYNWRTLRYGACCCLQTRSELTKVKYRVTVLKATEKTRFWSGRVYCDYQVRHIERAYLIWRLRDELNIVNWIDEETCRKWDAENQAAKKPPLPPVSLPTLPPEQPGELIVPGFPALRFKQKPAQHELPRSTFDPMRHISCPSPTTPQPPLSLPDFDFPRRREPAPPFPDVPPNRP